MIFMPIQILTLLRMPLLGVTPVLILGPASIRILILKGFPE